MRNCLVTAALAVLVSGPALAQLAPLELTCPMSPHDQEQMRQIGYPENANQVMHLEISKRTHSVVVWETSPNSLDTSKAKYRFKTSRKVLTWLIGGGDDDPAHASLDLGTMIYTNVPPIVSLTSTWVCTQ